MNDSSKPVLVIGIGNRYRRDDGVGPEVVKLLRARRPEGAILLEHSGEGASLMECWDGADTVIVIDAVRSTGTPGTVHRLEPDRQPIPSELFHYSTHAFSLAEAVEMARALRKLPQRMVIYGIEGTDFSAGDTMTPFVLAAAGTVVGKVLEDLAGASPPGARPQ